MSELTDAERKILADLLELAADQFGNHGCNDYELENTDENRRIVEAVQVWGTGEDDREVQISSDGKIYSQDYSLMSYFAFRLRRTRTGAEG